MTNGSLSRYFTDVIAKILRRVEVDPASSNQHELNGTKELKKIIRTLEETGFDCRFIYLSDDVEEIVADAKVTWYDARKNNPDRNAEFRLYFPRNPVFDKARESDMLFLARRTDGTLLMVVCPARSTIESQLFWLFGLAHPEGNHSTYIGIDTGQTREIDLAGRFILESIGIQIQEPENELLDRLVKPYNGDFPGVKEFSTLARNNLPEAINIIEDPDHALVALMNWELKLFKRLEQYNVSRRIKEGFMEAGGETADVQAFITYSLSVQNRRKSRAGAAFEQHVKYILEGNKLRFSAGQLTENKSKPDFLFPNISSYHNPDFPAEMLTMVGAKTTAKDRWRQVLAEADRIPHKHLLTLQPGISEDQTNQMRAMNLQLVLPTEIHATYKPSQREWLMSVHSLIQLLRTKERNAIH